MTVRGTRSGAAAWLPYAGFVLAAGGVIFQAGSLSSKIERNTERIVALEASDRARADTINTINLRGARIEALLEERLPRHEGEARR